MRDDHRLVDLSHPILEAVDVVRVAPTQANVKVCFEGEELVRRLHTFDPARSPSFALHPLQEVSVSAAVVSAFGL